MCLYRDHMGGNQFPMKASLQLDLIEEEITDPETQASLPNRRILLKWLSRELNRLASFE